MSEEYDTDKITSLVESVQTVVEDYVSQSKVFDGLDLNLGAIQMNEDQRIGLRIDDQHGATIMLLFPEETENQDLFKAGLSSILRNWVNKTLDMAAEEEESNA